MGKTPAEIRSKRKGGHNSDESSTGHGLLDKPPAFIKRRTFQEHANSRRATLQAQAFGINLSFSLSPIFVSNFALQSTQEQAVEKVSRARRHRFAAC
jgi:hypothetical protein